MAKNKSNGPALGFEAKLWQAADALRSNMSAANYKHVVLGLIFLKYVSDAFEELHAKLEANKKSGSDPEDKDEYLAENVFWVPKEARWSAITSKAKLPNNGKMVDDDIPYIALEHMPKRSIALGDWSTGEGIESNKSGFRRGDILFGKLRPYFHKVGIAPLDGVCSTDILVIAPKCPEWFGFAACHLSSDAVIEYADRASTGTKMPRTNWNDLAAFGIVIPPMELSNAFTTFSTESLIIFTTIFSHPAPFPPSATRCCLSY